MFGVARYGDEEGCPGSMDSLFYRLVLGGRDLWCPCITVFFTRRPSTATIITNLATSGTILFRDPRLQVIFG